MKNKNIIEKKPIYKKWWFWAVAAVFAVGTIAGGEEDKKADPADRIEIKEEAKVENGKGKEEKAEAKEEKEPTEKAEVKEEDNRPVAPLLKAHVFDVQNDTTGRWKYLTISESIDPADYAVDFFSEKIAGTGDMYFIINFANKTTTSIQDVGGMIDVRTLEYVDGEEHDAKSIGSGTLLTEVYYDPETGEELNF